MKLLLAKLVLWIINNLITGFGSIIIRLFNLQHSTDTQKGRVKGINGFTLDIACTRYVIPLEVTFLFKVYLLKMCYNIAVLKIL